MTLDLEFRLRAERTPNPQCIKWVVHPPLATAGRTAYFREAPRRTVSPLAAALFAIPGVLEVLVVADFVTITKDAAVEWPTLAEPVASAIKRSVTGDTAVFGPEAASFDPPDQGEGTGGTADRIRHILDHEIRPLVARDGGELLFVEYRDGVVQLALQGACSGCPNSTQTLKFGIEERLKAAIPEVREVVAL